MGTDETNNARTIQPADNGEEIETSSVKMPLSPREGRKMERMLQQAEVARPPGGAETLQGLRRTRDTRGKDFPIEAESWGWGGGGTSPSRE